MTIQSFKDEGVEISSYEAKTWTLVSENQKIIRMLVSSSYFYAITLILYITVNYKYTQPWESGKKDDGNFIFIFAVTNVRYGGNTTAKILKHGRLTEIVIMAFAIRLFFYIFTCPLIINL